MGSANLQSESCPVEFVTMLRYKQSVGYGIITFEIAALLIAAYSESIDASTFKPVTDYTDVLKYVGRTSISAPFLFGTTLSVFGASIRASCYHHMGKHFTFELTLQKDHQLVTSGPYSIVRHPGYISIFAFFGGSVLSLFGPGSFWLAADLWQYPIAKLLGVYYIFDTIYVSAVLFTRVAKEDEVLQREFKDQWANWASRTPYRLIPFVY